MRSTLSAVAGAVLIAGLAAPAGVAGAESGTDRAAAERPPPLEIRTLSSRPGFVTGGNVLLEIGVPAGVRLDDVTVTVDGVDVTDDFRPESVRPFAGANGEGDQILTGLVSALPEGRSTVVANAGSAGTPAVRRLVDHPITGPLFSGPHQDPFICDTESFALDVGGTLGPPLDDDCSAATRVDYLYRTTDGGFVPLPDGEVRPDDLAWTTISTGATVPYIVRVETGTINRAIYETAILHDPLAADPDPWNRPEGWNDRLIYKFGGGCPGGYNVQGRGTGDVMDHGMLEQGYAIASSSLNVFGNNCNDLLASESMAMVKERFIEAYGPPLLTIGWGSSGGAYQSHQISDNYPGLLDGILVAASFPDVGFGTIHTISDARLLYHYFSELAPDELTQEQERAIAGFGQWGNLPNLSNSALRIDPRVGCKGWFPSELAYDPVTNPDGTRCDVYSHTSNAYGIDPATGVVRRPLDNVGLQYGLEALESGVIDVDAFLDLNERIGGYDADADFIPERTEADLKGTAAAYRGGRMLNGGGGLGDIPIVDVRHYADDQPNGNIHLMFHGFSTRERLMKANGTADNHIMLVADSGSLSSANWLVRPALAELDAWVTAIVEDAEPAREPIDKIRRNRPDWLEDSCWTAADRTRIREPQLPEIGGTTCTDEYPVWPSPRMVAGGPLANDVIKCRLAPFDAVDYGVEFTDEQRRRARTTVFPDGVCDWSRPGVEQQGLAGTWQRY